MLLYSWDLNFQTTQEFAPASGKSQIWLPEGEVEREMSIGASCKTQHEKTSRDNGLWNLEILNLNSDHARS